MYRAFPPPVPACVLDRSSTVRNRQSFCLSSFSNPSTARDHPLFFHVLTFVRFQSDVIVIPRAAPPFHSNSPTKPKVRSSTSFRPSVHILQTPSPKPTHAMLMKRKIFLSALNILFSPLASRSIATSATSSPPTSAKISQGVRFKVRQPTFRLEASNSPPTLSPPLPSLSTSSSVVPRSLPISISEEKGPPTLPLFFLVFQFNRKSSLVPLLSPASPRGPSFFSHGLPTPERVHFVYLYDVPPFVPAPRVAL